MDSVMDSTMDPTMDPTMDSSMDSTMDSTTKKHIEFNKGTIGFDPQNQYIGLKTPIDQIGFQGTKSPNPMDTNWGGIKYTQKSLEIDGDSKRPPESPLLARVLNRD